MSRHGDERRARRLAQLQARTGRHAGGRNGDQNREKMPNERLLRALVARGGFRERGGPGEKGGADGGGFAPDLSRRLGPKGRFIAAATVIGMVITGAAIWYERRMAAPPVFEADWRNPVLVRQGQELYRTHCAACHGAALQGQGGWDGDYPHGGRPALPLDGTGPLWRLGDADIRDVIRYGGQPFSPRGYRNDMPGFEARISGAGLRALVAFIKSRWPDEIHIRQQERAADGERDPKG